MSRFDYHLGYYANAENWLAAVSSLESVLEDYFADVIISRGEGVFETDHVDSITISHVGVEAEVMGTRPYRVELHFQDKGLYANCSCPYEAPCKHVVALVLSVLERIDEDDLARESQANEYLLKHLQELDRADLIALVMRYLPREYKKQIHYQNLSPEQLHSKLDALWARTITLEEAELEDIDHFDEQLVLRLDRLRPFWTSQPERVILMLEELLLAIETAVEAGYLYHHYYDAYFNGRLLSDYLAELCCSQSEAKAGEFIRRLLEFDQELEYRNGYGYSFPASLLTAYSNSGERTQQWLRSLLLQPEVFQQLGEWRIRLLERVSDQLPGPQLMALLELLAPDDLSMTLRLAELLVSEAQPLAAIEWLDQFYESILSEDFMPPTFDYSQLSFFELRLPLAVAYPQKDKSAIELATAYLKRYPRAKTLQFCLAQLPERQQELEERLLKVSVDHYFQFLEEEGRLAEAVALAEQQAEYQTAYLLKPFYRRHADRYPAAARAVCYAAIDELLPQADRRAYEQIVVLLAEVQALEEAETFQLLIEQLRTEYKRRPTMMRMLKEAGW